MTDIVKRLCAPVSDDDDYMIGQWPGEPPKKYDALRLEAADEIERLRAEVETWVGHAKTAIWSDSEECKLLTADNERLRADSQKAALDYLGQIGQLSDEITRLRAALKLIADGKETEPRILASAMLEGKHD